MGMRTIRSRDRCSWNGGLLQEKAKCSAKFYVVGNLWIFFLGLCCEVIREECITTSFSLSFLE